MTGKYFENRLIFGKVKAYKNDGFSEHIENCCYPTKGIFLTKQKFAFIITPMSNVIERRIYDCDHQAGSHETGND